MLLVLVERFVIFYVRLGRIIDRVHRGRDRSWARVVVQYGEMNRWRNDDNRRVERSATEEGSIEECSKHVHRDGAGGKPSGWNVMQRPNFSQDREVMDGSKQKERESAWRAHRGEIEVHAP